MKLMTIAATVSLTLALGCSRKGAGGPARVPVTVAHVEQRAVPFEIPATGTAEPVLSFVDNSVDTTSGTVLLKAEFPNRDNALWPGEFLTVRLQLYVEDSAVVVPSQAVMNGQQGTYLFVVNQDGTARSQPVTVERTAGAYAVIAQGVRAGDDAGTDGQVRLVTGAAVEVKGVAEAARELGGDK